jgi:hypothetical protein
VILKVNIGVDTSYELHRVLTAALGPLAQCGRAKVGASVWIIMSNKKSFDVVSIAAGKATDVAGWRK